MKNTSTSVSLDFAVLLTIIFGIFKLFKVIDWSWTWVLSPLWISFIFVLVVAVIYVVILKIKR